MDFFQQGIPLGKWFGITVVIHWMFLLYAGNELLQSAHPAMVAIYLALLFGTVLVHEFGHALSCKAVGGVAYHIVLWPLGGIAFVQPPMRPGAAFITTVCGPLVNAVLWPIFWWATVYAVPYISVHMNLSIHGEYNLWFICNSMWSINEGLLLFNLIPAYPMDGGRMLQEILWFGLGYPKSLHIAGMVGTVAGGAFIVLGTGVRSVTIPLVDITLGGSFDILLIVIGAMCMMQSFAIYQQSQQIQSWRKN